VLVWAATQAAYRSIIVIVVTTVLPPAMSAVVVPPAFLTIADIVSVAVVDGVRRIDHWRGRLIDDGGLLDI
jgi:hypothetical protein